MSGTFGHESWSASGMAARLAGVSMMLGTTQFTVIPVPRTSLAAWLHHAQRVVIADVGGHSRAERPASDTRQHACRYAERGDG